MPKNEEIKKNNEQISALIYQRLKETEEERKKLFTNSDGKKRTLNDLTEAERIRAAKLYEFIFGMLTKRDEYRLYKEVHPEVRPTDFIFVNNVAFTQIIEEDQEIQQAIKEGKVEPVQKFVNVMDEGGFMGAKIIEKVTETAADVISFTTLKVAEASGEILKDGVMLVAEALEKDLENLNEGNPEDQFEGSEFDEEPIENINKEIENTGENGEEINENKENTGEEKNTGEEINENNLEINTDIERIPVPEMEKIKEYLVPKDKKGKPIVDNNENLPISDRVIMEFDKYGQKFYEEEKVFNDSLKEIRKTLVKEKPRKDKNDVLMPPSENYKEAKRQWEEAIDARLYKLADSYRMKEITGYYLTKRAEQLNALKNFKGADIPEIPKTPSLYEKKIEKPGEEDVNSGSESEEELKDLLTARLSGTLWKDHIKDLPTFVEWKLNQDPDIALEEFTREDWEILYQNECRRQMEKNPPALPEGVVMPEEMTQEEKDKMLFHEMNENAGQIVVDDIMNDPSIPARQKTGVKGNINIGNQLLLYDAIEKLKKNLIDYIPTIVEAEENPEEANRKYGDKKEKDQDASAIVEMMENTLVKVTAPSIGFALIEKNDQRVPGGLYFWGFIKKLEKEPAFEKVVKPLIREIAKEYKEEKQKNPDIKVQDLPKFKRFIEMQTDGSIVSAFGLQVKIDKAKKKAADAKAAKKTAQSSAVKHALNQLNVPAAEKKEIPKEEKPEKEIQNGEQKPEGTVPPVIGKEPSKGPVKGF